MKKKILSLGLALALASTLCGCGGTNDGDAELFGSGVLFTRTASDEEAFSQFLENRDDEELELEDASVPLAGQPAEQQPAEAGDGWLLVRYAVDENGEAEPLWYRVWTEENCWSRENLPCQSGDWRPLIP